MYINNSHTRPGMRAIVYSFLLICLSTAVAHAHPLGIFSVNRYTRIELAADKVQLFYIVDIAEIPSIQEFKRIDKNGDGLADSSEIHAYLAQFVDSLRGKCSLRI